MTSSNAASVVERAVAIARSTADLVTLVGPTASGKTELAVALAERLGGEIVTADSVQIYRRFDAGSGKPTRDELARAPHHVLSVLDPLEEVDAAKWAGLAAHAVDEIRSRGRVPIVCGGTFFWVRALLRGLAAAPPASPEVRARHRAIAESEGRTTLHERLRAVDPASAARLHPNDLVRVSRALEVQELSGRPLSDWHREHASSGPHPRPARLLAVARDPAALTERIQARVSAWLASGWIEEVRELLAGGYAEARAMHSVGYEQVRAMLEGHLARAELAPSIVRATRVFARRQRTWLNREDVVWLG
jgi:tRNA dimethylallyltransferase